MAGESSPTIRDHYASADGPRPAGTYRVVGVDETSVTLLRVTDSDGRRRSTGEVATVSRPMDGFEPARNPDAGIRPIRWLRNQLQGVGWTVRMLTGL